MCEASFWAGQNVEPENLEGSNLEETTFFVVDEQPFFMAGS